MKYLIDLILFYINLTYLFKLKYSSSGDIDL